MSTKCNNYKVHYGRKKAQLENALNKISTLEKQSTEEKKDVTAKPTHDAIASEIAIVTNFMGWEEFDNADPASQRRVDNHFHDWNNWLELAVATTGDADDLTRDRVYRDGVTDLIARGPITGMHCGESTLAKKVAPPPSGSSIGTYDMKKAALLLPGADVAVRRAALTALIGRPLWPCQALAVMTKFYMSDGPLGIHNSGSNYADDIIIGATDMQNYDIMSTLAYAAMLNRCFSEVTDRRTGQLTMLAYDPQTVRAHSVGQLINRAMDSGFLINSERGKILPSKVFYSPLGRLTYPQLVFNWSSVADTAYMTVVLNSRPLAVQDSGEIRKHFAEFLTKNYWDKPRRMDAAGPADMESARQYAREDYHRDNRRQGGNNGQVSSDTPYHLNKFRADTKERPETILLE